MSAKKKDPVRYTEIRNSKALRDYFVDERFEAGIQLRGTEVKSIRAGRAQITDAFAARRMDATVKAALSGRRLNEIEDN